MNPAPLWTANDLCAATGGTCESAVAATGVSIDSRTLVRGDLFVAIKGPAFDGHDFVTDAFANGAVAAVVDHDVANIPADAPCLRVGDTMTALEAMGRAARAHTSARIAAVTGSVGKTGAKDALRHVLGGIAPTHASEGSLNNHWGLPLSLARMERDAAFGIFEMGMNHPGEIAPLSKLARPHVALITTVEGVHKGHFPSIEAIADAKAEIFEGLEPDGTAVLNRDNRFFEHLDECARKCGVASVIGFGADDGSDVRLLSLDLDADGSDLSADIMGTIVSYRVGVAGRHWAENSLGVLAVVHALGADVGMAANAFSDFHAPKGRGQRHTVRFGDGDIVLIDESYNASPVSVKAAVDLLALTAAKTAARSIAVLGDMLELGTEAAADHAALKDVLSEREIDLVFTAGPLMENLYQARGANGRDMHANDSGALIPMVVGAVRAGDVIMVKGSAGSRMGRVVDALAALDTRTHARAVNGN